MHSIEVTTNGLGTTDGAVSTAAARTMGFTEIKSWLRHRHPMLFLDRILDYEPGARIVAGLAVSAQMDAIAGHFPERAIFPASHLTQAFAQAGIILFQLGTSRIQDDELTLVGAMNSRFLKIIVPGDHVVITVHHDRIVGDTFFFSGKATVQDRPVATFRANLVRRKVADMGDQLW